MRHSLRVLERIVDTHPQAEVLDALSGIVTVVQDRGEFSADTEQRIQRNGWEHPEQSYRRGFQQGAHEVARALEKAGLIDGRTSCRLRDYIAELGVWRYMRPLKREWPRDCAPRININRLR